jgi:hypothetical protein
MLLLVEREEIGGVVRLSLRLFSVFLVFFLFLIATSGHNTSNFLSHPAAAFSSHTLSSSNSSHIHQSSTTRYKQKQNETHYENITHLHKHL